jgi:pteridine reductase
MKLDGKVVLVTGGARRVGAAIVRALHADGARVILHCRNSVLAADTLADSLNAVRAGSVTVATADLGDVDAPAALVTRALEAFGRLDGLINNASSFYPTPIGQIRLADWDSLMASNLKAPLFLAQAAAHALRATGGAIVNITDVHAERPLAGYPLYCAAKGGLLALTRALAIELAPEVRVNAVAPGPVLWPEDGQLADGAARKAIVADTLLGHEGSAEDIARTVRFLLADAPYITGQVINVDGGRTAHL